MRDLEETLGRLRRDFSEGKFVIHREKLTPFKLSCSFFDCVDKRLLESKNGKLPDELLEFYSLSNGALLFEDKKFGQWGLELFSIDKLEKETAEYFESRSADALHGDLVIGKFIGDSDLLVMTCDSSASDHNEIIVSGSIDPRNEWYRVSDGLHNFLSDYAKENGDKFWENN